MTHRPKLFAGIELDDRTRAWSASIAARLEAMGFPGRFERADKLHITLAFLGWVNAERVDAVREVIRTAAHAARPFVMTIDKIGAFPHERRPRVVWLGSHEQGRDFRGLSRDVQSAYAALGFTFAQEAVAHITIARVKGGSAHLPLLDVEPVALPVSYLTLFESLPAGGTTRYEVRERAPLSG